MGKKLTFFEAVFKKLTNMLTNIVMGFLSKKSHFNVSYPTFPYARLRKAIMPGDVLLVEGIERYSTVVKYFTQSVWSHSAIYIGNGKLIEADFKRGVIELDLEFYRHLNTRVCRPIGLEKQNIEEVIDYCHKQKGHQYDLKNILDLARYLLPLPPVPNRWKRRVFEFGSGTPTKVICSSMIASAFQSIGYPILPITIRQKRKRLFKKRPATHITPADFDRSPYFVVVNPNQQTGFNFKTINWHKEMEEELEYFIRPKDFNK